VETSGAHPKRDCSGMQLCEKCEGRLCRIKGMKYQHKPGLICQACYDKKHPRKKRAPRPKRSVSTVEPPKAKRHRRTHSDPGEPASLTRKRTRALPPATVPAPKKTRVYTPASDPSLLLEHAHAQRLALLAAEKTGIPRVSSTVQWSVTLCD
jgi:hypothetical protein